MEKGQTMKKATDKNTIEIRLTIRGDAAGVASTLANGFPLEALVDIRDGMTAELEQRRIRRPARGARRARIAGRK